MRALAAIVFSAIAVFAAATSASAADLTYVPKRHHVRYAPPPCSPCAVALRPSPPVEYVAYPIAYVPVRRHHYRYWAGGCQVDPWVSCYRGWNKAVIAGHVAPGRYQLVRQKEYLHEPELVVVNRNYADEPGCVTRCRW